MKLSKIDLSNIVAVGHAEGHLGLLIDKGDEVEYIEIAAPEAAYHGLQQVAFIANYDFPDLPAEAEAIAMQSVNSSMAKSIGYDEDRQILQIEFQSGSVYQYDEVELETWQSLTEASSTGVFFNAQIKGYYPSRYVGDTTLDNPVEFDEAISCDEED